MISDAVHLPASTASTRRRPSGSRAIAKSAVWSCPLVVPTAKATPAKVRCGSAQWSASTKLSAFASRRVGGGPKGAPGLHLGTWQPTLVRSARPQAVGSGGGEVLRPRGTGSR
jgi:hypothetical protein